MLDRHFSRFILSILIIGALLRLSVLVFGVNLPVMWDARRYVGAALALISYVDTSGPDAVDNPEADREAFDYYYQKYIQGEKIDWLYYRPLRLQQARDDVFFSGPLYPAALAVLFAISPVADFTVARLFGIVGDILALWLLILIAIRLVGRRSALVAGLLYAVYFPFVLTSTSLLLEPSTSLLLLATVYFLIRAVDNDRVRPLIWAGLLLGLLLLNKPTAMLLGVPALVGLYYYSRRTWNIRQFVLRAVRVVAPLLVIVLVWAVVASIKYGQPALRDPGYSGANIRQSSSLEFEGYDLDQVEPEFWQRNPYGDLVQRFPEYVGLFAKKFERLYSRPYNDFERRLILPPVGQEFMHLVIILLGALGLLHLLMHDVRKGIWPLAIVSYYTGIHLIFHSINRYSYNALPLIILCASVMIVLARDRLREEDPLVRRATLYGLASLVLAGLITPALPDLLHLPVTLVSIWMLAIVKLALLGFAAYQLLRQAAASRIIHLVSVGLFVFVCGAVFWSQQISRNAWAEFDSSLENSTYRAGTRIFSSSLPEPEEGEKYYLAIDLDVPGPLTNGYQVNINGTSSVFSAGYAEPSDFFYPKRQVYQAYARLTGCPLSSFRQYRLTELSAEAVRASLLGLGYLDISVRLPDGAPAGESLNLHGIRPCGNDTVYIPTPEAAYASIERWVHRRDARIRIPVDFISDSTISYYIEGNQSDLTADQDLGSGIGRQAGRFNIFLVRVTGDGDYTVY